LNRQNNMISREEVKHIAKLARLGLTKEEIEKLQKDLSVTLSYIKKLEELNYDGVLPTSHPVKLENITRKDEAKTRELGEASDLIKMAPGNKEGYIKTRRILFS